MPLFKYFLVLYCEMEAWTPKNHNVNKVPNAYSLAEKAPEEEDKSKWNFLW